MEKYTAKVQLQWLGDEPIMARLQKGGQKVQFKSGEIHLAEFNKAKELASHYKKFVIVTEGEESEEVAQPAVTKKSKKTK